MFESLSVYCLYQKGLVETICYSGIVKPNILVKKLKRRKKKRKKEVWVKHRTFPHSNFVILLLFVVFLSIYSYASSSIDRAE